MAVSAQTVLEIFLVIKLHSYTHSLIDKLHFHLINSSCSYIITVCMYVAYARLGSISLDIQYIILYALLCMALVYVLYIRTYTSYASQEAHEGGGWQKLWTKIQTLILYVIRILPLVIEHLCIDAKIIYSTFVYSNTTGKEMSIEYQTINSNLLQQTCCLQLQLQTQSPSMLRLAHSQMILHA